MTLGPNKEHVMTAKTKQQAAPFDVERFRKELGLRIQRLVAESIRGWRDCGNAKCRRTKRCASDRFECIAKWRSTLPPLTPEQAEARLQEFRIELEVRKRFNGESVTEAQLRKAIHKEKAARRAAMPPLAGDDAAASVAQAPPLSPQIEQPVAETCREGDRRAGPRIRQL
jgi:anti-sigma-K factor RskA